MTKAGPLIASIHFLYVFNSTEDPLVISRYLAFT